MLENPTAWTKKLLQMIWNFSTFLVVKSNIDSSSFHINKTTNYKTNWRHYLGSCNVNYIFCKGEDILCLTIYRKGLLTPILDHKKELESRIPDTILNNLCPHGAYIPVDSRKWELPVREKKSKILRDFPGGPVVKIPGFHCRKCGFNPWWGN